ncbi:hypothetical protein [Streptomyces sp. NPDC001843]|uniref:hypothetical protein n=1 Tax=Streptomyces sp. NPDC001843 TaxID=3364617 RepID=UPI00367C3204
MAARRGPLRAYQWQGGSGGPAQVGEARGDLRTHPPCRRPLVQDRQRLAHLSGDPPQRDRRPRGLLTGRDQLPGPGRQRCAGRTERPGQPQTGGPPHPPPARQRVTGGRQRGPGGLGVPGHRPQRLGDVYPVLVRRAADHDSRAGGAALAPRGPYAASARRTSRRVWQRP